MTPDNLATLIAAIRDEWRKSRTAAAYYLPKEHMGLFLALEALGQGSVDEARALAMLSQRVGHFCEALAGRVARAPKNGMQAPFHGDFAGIQPSQQGRLEWWVRDFCNTGAVARRKDEP